MTPEQKNTLVDVTNNTIALAIVLLVSWMLYVDSAIWQCGEIGFLSVTMLYSAVILSFILGLSLRQFVASRVSGKRLLFMLVAVAITPVFFDVYGYGGPECRSKSLVEEVGS